MMKTINLVFLIVFTTALLGCGPAGFSMTTGHKQPTKAERDELSQLIGQSPEAVIKKLGLPNKAFILSDRQLMLYITSVTNYQREAGIFLLIPVPIGPLEQASSSSLRCLIIEIDSDNLVKKYTIKDTAHKNKDHSSRCLKRFFSKYELKDITFVRTNITIDIKPGIDPNTIIPMSKDVVPVAILGSMNFDPLEVDPSTVRFGPDQASPTPSHDYEDVNNDGFMDRIFHFNTQEAGIVCGDTEATLNGETFFNKISITGTDKVNTAGCKSSTSETIGPILWMARIVFI